jgi:hypothetical protein
MPPKNPPQRFVSETTRPSLTRSASLASPPLIAARRKPSPNSTPFTAGTEKRLAQPARKSENGGLHNAAHRVAGGFRRADSFFHPRLGLGRRRKITRRNFAELLAGWKRRIRNAADGIYPPVNLGASAAHYLFRHAPGETERRGEPAGKMPAASHIGETAVFKRRRPVRVSGAQRSAVAAGTGVTVFYQAAERKPRRPSSKQSADYLDGVRFVPRGRKFVSARRAAAHIPRDFAGVDFLSGRQSVYDNSDGGAVRLPENRQPDFVSPHVHRLSPSISRQKSG